MAIEKQIKTKISLRYLDYATWSAESFKTEKPLKGEVWFCSIPQGNANATTAPTMLFKVGDGVNTFGDLKWCSALAADVYDWAKVAGGNVFTKDGVGNVVSGIEYDATLNAGKGGFKFTTASVATAEGLEDLQEAVEAIEKDIADNRDAWNKYEDTRYSFSTDGDKLVVKKTLYINGVAGTEEAVGTYEFLTTDEVNTILNAYYTKNDADAKFVTGLAEGSTNGTVKAVINGVAGADVAIHGLQDAAYTTVAALNATAKGYADAVEAKLPTSADYGVLGVTAGDDTITIGGTAQNPTIAVTANKFDAYGAAAQALTDAKTYADNNDANTEYHVEYDSTNKKIKLVAGADASKMEIDATDFIKDGMIDTVTIGEDNDLVITFNTAAGKDEIRLPLDQLVDIYTGHEGARIVVTVSSDKSISAELVAGSISKNYLDAAIQTSLGLADSALQAKDLAEYAKTENVVTNEEFTAFEATNTEAIGKKLDKATYDAYIAGKELSDAELKKYADDEADAAETAAKAYVDEKTAGYTVDAEGNINIAPTAESNYDSYISVAHGDNSGGVSLVSGGTSIIMAGDAYDININASTIRLSGTVSIGTKEVATQEYVQTYAATAEQGGKADTALQNIEVDTGLKVTEKGTGTSQKISIDEDVIFVLDCNW